MKRIVSLLVILAGAYLAYTRQSSPVVSTPVQSPATASSSDRSSAANDGSQLIERAFREQRSNIQVEVQATISKVLRDDNEGARHQRFIISLPSNRTLLVAHNIDLAERINDLQAGAAITLKGEYEWNPQGGVLHWTHHDPGGRHPAGWVKYRGQLYQ